MKPESSNGRPCLTYCTNVHPGSNLEQVKSSLERWSAPLRSRLGEGWDDPFPLGLYFSVDTVKDLGAAGAAEEFGAWLGARSFRAVTLNCFPYRGFHESSVKHEVFKPTWLEEARARYSIDAAGVFARMLPEGAVASISTVAGSYKAWGNDEEVHQNIAAQLIRVAVELDRLRSDTGREIILSLEPEPLTTLELSDEAVAFFEAWVFSESGKELAQKHGAEPSRAEEILRRHLGICYDTCHQAVEFEDAAESLGKIAAAGIRLGKLQLSSALRLAEPAENPAGLEHLKRFAEPRYLHQCVVRRRDSVIQIFEDLPQFVAEMEDKLSTVEEVRSHFHVPVDREEIPPLSTTRPDMRAALAEALRLELTDTFEVETYTFDVLPDESGVAPGDEGLISALEAELTSVARDLDDLLAPGDAL